MEVAGSLQQLCARQTAGVEATVHVVRTSFQQEEAEAVFLMDASNLTIMELIYSCVCVCVCVRAHTRKFLPEKKKVKGHQFCGGSWGPGGHLYLFQNWITLAY